MNLNIIIESPRIMYPLPLPREENTRTSKGEYVLLVTMESLNVTTPKELINSKDEQFKNRDMKLYDTVEIFFDGFALSVVEEAMLDDQRLSARATETVFMVRKRKQSGTLFRAKINQEHQPFYVIENLTWKVVVHQLKKKVTLFREYGYQPNFIIKGQLVTLTANLKVDYVNLLSKHRSAKKKAELELVNENSLTPTLTNSNAQKTNMRDDIRKINTHGIEFLFQMEEVNLKLKHDDELDWLVFRSRDIRVIQSDEIENIGICINLESLELLEMMPNKTFNTLIYIDQTEDRGTSNDKIIVTVPKVDKPDTKQIIEVNFSTVYFYWKPDYTEKLMSFLWTFLGKEAGSIPEGRTSVQSTRKSVTGKDMETVNSVVVVRVSMFSMNFGLKDFTLFKMAASGFDLCLTSRSDRLEVDGGVGKLTISDMTNYPETKLTLFDMLEEEMGEKSFDTTLAHCKLSFSYVLLEKTSSHIQNFITSKLSVDLSELTLLFFQQPILRIINYLLNHFLPVLSKPKSFQDMSNALVTPGFMSIKVTADKPKLKLYNHPGSQMHIEFQIGYMVIFNKQYQNVEAAPKNFFEYLWYESYSIRLSDIRIYTKSDTQLHYFGYTAALNVLISKLTMKTEYTKTHPDVGNIDLVLTDYNPCIRI